MRACAPSCSAIRSQGRRGGPPRPVAARAYAQAYGSGDNAALKTRITHLVAPTNRGKYADREAHAAIAEACRQLSVNAIEAVPVLGSPPAVEGRWRLLYSSVEPLRSSPVFWVLAAQNRSLAAQLFGVTDQIPIADVGDVVQVIDLSSGTLESRMDLNVFPGVRGTVVTQCAARAAPPDAVELTVQRATVQGATTFLAPLVNRLSLPVKAAVELARGTGAAQVAMRTTYVDQDFRVSVFADDLFVFQRI